MTLSGKLYLWYEQGMTYSAWTFLDDANVAPEGVHTVESGDHLTVFDRANPSVVLWDGIVDVSAKVHTCHSSHGRVICLPPVNVPLDDWVGWFVYEYPAKLDKKA